MIVWSVHCNDRVYSPDTHHILSLLLTCEKKNSNGTITLGYIKDSFTILSHLFSPENINNELLHLGASVQGWNVTSYQQNNDNFRSDAVVIIIHLYS